MTQAPQPPQQPPVPQTPYQPQMQAGGMKPHRGGAVLVLGILGLVVCFICGIIAWVMGNTDMREMREGRMDPAGMSSTNAGRICGMISVILAIVGVGIWLIMLIAGVGVGVFR